MASDPLLVAVVSPQPVVQHGLVSLLSRHPERVTVVPHADSVDPDVVLYDVVGLVDNDLSDLRGLLGSTSARVLAVSRDLRPDLAARALAEGAHGSVPIGVSEPGLLDAVETVVSGSAPEEARPRGVGLTDREVQVLTLIAQGRTNQQIAAELYLSPNSIKTYVRTGYRKIGAVSRSQAVSWAIRHGFPADGPHTH